MDTTVNMDREKAFELLEKYVSTPHIKIHSLATEAVMRALATRLSPGDEQMWAVAGLLHDLDEDCCDWRNDMSTHGPKSIEILKEHNFGNEDIYNAILAHNPENGKKPETKFEIAMYAGDPITGFIKDRQREGKIDNKEDEGNQICRRSKQGGHDGDRKDRDPIRRVC